MGRKEVVAVDMTADIVATRKLLRELREEELLDLVRKGGFRSSRDAISKFFAAITQRFPVDNQELILCVMNLAASLIVIRKTLFDGSEAPQWVIEELKERKQILEDLGISKEEVLHLMNEIGKITPQEEAITEGEKGKATR
ncbi:MAG: hypothetical protein NUV96_01055 [Candidatus Colwellbacteria bacterium]|nr:hypothetical protein [Candidatus Colwellbacteria bacterium]